MGSKKAASDRAARVAAMQAEQARKDRRWKIGIGIAAAIPVLAVVIALILPLAMGLRSTSAAPATGPIDGVQTFTGLSANHVSTPVTYAQNPPVGGDHTGHWQNCGIYDEPSTPIEPAVHSLERGKPYAMQSPMEGLPSPIVASAWGLQLTVDTAADERLGTFLATYMQGPQTPERGAACFGGVGKPSL